MTQNSIRILNIFNVDTFLAVIFIIALLGIAYTTYLVLSKKQYKNILYSTLFILTIFGLGILSGILADEGIISANSIFDNGLLYLPIAILLFMVQIGKMFIDKKRR